MLHIKRSLHQCYEVGSDLPIMIRTSHSQVRCSMRHHKTWIHSNSQVHKTRTRCTRGVDKAFMCHLQKQGKLHKITEHVNLQQTCAFHTSQSRHIAPALLAMIKPIASAVTVRGGRYVKTVGYKNFSQAHLP